jgi:hypothetical protein
MLRAGLLGNVSVTLHISQSRPFTTTWRYLIPSTVIPFTAPVESQMISHMQLCSQCFHVSQLYRCAAPVQDPPVMEYLQEASRSTYDITLKVSIQPEGSPEPSVITHSNLKHL